MAKNYLVDDTDRAGAILQNLIRIKEMRPVKDPVVVEGIIQERLQFQVEGNWDNLFNLSDKFDLARKGLSFMDMGLLNAGLATRRYYKGGGYLRINPKFRIVDFEGDGSVISKVTALMDMALPSLDKEINLNDVAEFARNNPATVASTLAGYGLGGAAGAAFGAGVGTLIDNVNENGVKSTAKSVAKAVSNPAETFTNAIGSAYEFAKGVGIVTNSASPVFVQIGNFFWREFVIENVSVELSRELTEAGPLYADIDLTLSTIEVATKNNVGFQSMLFSKSRVEVRP